MCQCTLFDVGGVEKHSIEYCTKDQSNVEDVKDRSNTPKGCNAMYVKDVKENTHTFWLITSLILNGFSIRKKFWKAETQDFSAIPSNTVYIMSEMSEIDQVHLRAVMLFMSETSEIIINLQYT